jgi:hypothetical protein
MVIQVIFDDNTNDIIYSHMLQFGIEFGLNGNKIVMFYRSSENAWVATSRDLLRISAKQPSHYNGPERRNEVSLASYAFNPSNKGPEPHRGSARRINAVDSYGTT